MVVEGDVVWSWRTNIDKGSVRKEGFGNVGLKEEVGRIESLQ